MMTFNIRTEISRDVLKLLVAGPRQGTVVISDFKKKQQKQTSLPFSLM